jgi:electron transport complex protein RnfG
MTSELIDKFAVLRERVDYQGAMLGGVCTLIAMLLMMGKLMTQDEIALRIEEDRQALLDQVLPAHYFDNAPFEDTMTLDDPLFAELPTDVYLAKKDGQLTALVFQAETQGYGGTITLLMAIDINGTVIGVRTLSHKETPGLADAIEVSKSDWITVFNGLSIGNPPKSAWAVKKDGGQFDQFTGATITPRAIVASVLSGLEFHARQHSQLTQSEDNTHDR